MIGRTGNGQFSSLGCVLVLALAASGCKQEPAPQASESMPAAAVSLADGPDARPGISASEGKLILPVVAGNPGAAYFTLHNTGNSPATLAGIDVTGVGKAQMHKTEGSKMSTVDRLDLQPGAKVSFAPGGLHVMLFDIAPSLVAGGTTEMTLTFADGDKLSMPLAISKTGAENPADTGMEGMDMSHDDMAGMKH